VVVPNPDDQPANDQTPQPGTGAAGGPGKDLEDLDLDGLLAGAASEAAASQKAGSKPTRSAPRPEPVAEPDSFDSSPFPDVDVEPLEPTGAPTPIAEKPLPSGLVVIPRRLLIALAVVLLLLVGLSFLIGYLLGKQAGLARAAAVVQQEDAAKH
jgi:hypothetical protein